MRLAKYLAHAGVASRRRAERLIAQGRVTVDGAIADDPALDVDDDRAIAVNGEPVTGAERRETWMLNKPPGVISTARDPGGRPTVTDLVPDRARLYPVGRLDVDVSGLLLLTNDGELANALLHPSRGVPRTYRATVRRPPVRGQALARLRDGVELDDGRTAPARARRLASDVVELTIHEGRKRQVKRMLEAVGHPVRSLERTSFGPLVLGDLPAGTARRLRPAELERLRRETTRRPSPRPRPPRP